MHSTCAVLYCHLWPVALPHYLINGTIFGKKLNIKCVLTFSTAFVRNIYPSTRNSQRYHKCAYIVTYCYCYSCQILIKLDFLERFSKNTQIQNLIKIRPLRADLFHAEMNQQSLFAMGLQTIHAPSRYVLRFTTLYERTLPENHQRCKKVFCSPVINAMSLIITIFFLLLFPSVLLSSTCFTTSKYD
jgi:hypothetical protein